MIETDESIARFHDGFNCAQALLTTFGPRFGLDPAVAMRVAVGFGGGMGRQGHTCGALTGAYMIIGLIKGSSQPGDRETRESVYAAVREFSARFEAEYGATSCRELLGCNLADPAEYARAREEKLFKSHCPRFVAGAARLLEQMVE